MELFTVPNTRNKCFNADVSYFNSGVFFNAKFEFHYSSSIILTTDEAIMNNS